MFNPPFIMGTKRFNSVLHGLPRTQVLQGKVKVLGKMKKQIRLISKFTFHFATAIYLLALPTFYFIRGAVDALLPYEAGLCVALSSINGIMAGRDAVKCIKS